jgi:hypothetical protein
MELPLGFYLGWDWPWLVFFIVLGLSIALAAWANKWQVLWILPALVLYNGLYWEIPGWGMTVFKVLFWLAVLAVLATAVFPGVTRAAFVPVGMMVALIIWCLLLAVVAGAFNALFAPTEGGRAERNPGDVCVTIDEEPDEEVTQSEDDIAGKYEVDAMGNCTSIDEGEDNVETDTDPDSEPESSPTAGPEFMCPSHLVQRPMSDTERRRFIRDGIDAATPEKSWEKMGRALLHDAASLRQMSVTLGLSDVPELGQLRTSNGECLSEEGVELADDLINFGNGRLSSTFGFAPLDGNNSWIDRHGHLVISKKQLLAGDRKSLVFIDDEGREQHILVRCGNPVFATHD